MKKKEKTSQYAKTFRRVQNFVELQCLVDDLVDFLEYCLSMLLLP